MKPDDMNNQDIEQLLQHHARKAVEERWRRTLGADYARCSHRGAVRHYVASAAVTVVLAATLWWALPAWPADGTSACSPGQRRAAIALADQIITEL